MGEGMRHHSFARRAACAAGHPAWVVQFGYAPAARRCVALLAEQPARVADLARRAGYAPGTVEITLNALKRLGRVERDEWNEWSAR